MISPLGAVPVVYNGDERDIPGFAGRSAEAEIEAILDRPSSEWIEYEHRHEECVAAIDEAARGCAWHPGRLA
ncbi:MAG: hypothetical protein ACU0B9_18830 [Limimaricola soesokkakensis]|uniref:hypothetical protein n=1 Tax=Limimaricola soesokkakensis TaxID=1343159 RepID=UPI004059BB60